MRDIAKLLFGRETGILSELFGPGDGDESGLADQVRRAGEWCGGTPGHGAPRSRDQVIIREFRG